MFLKKNSYLECMMIIENLSITNIVAGLIILGVGILIADILAKLSKKLLESFELERVLGKRFPIYDLLSSIVRFMVYIVAIVWSVFQMGFEWIVLIMVCGFLGIVLIWKVLMSIREFVPNYIAKLKFKPKKGRKFKYHFNGRLKEVGLLESKVKTEEGELLYVPNKLFSK
jgi:hypothetical protein